METFDIVIFDLDGTLTDSSEGIINSIQYSLSKFNIQENDNQKLRRFIGPPLINSFREYYNLGEPEIDEAVKFYRDFYSRKGLFQNSLYSGIESLLNEMQKSGKRMMIATVKPSFYLDKILIYFDIKDYFEVYIGSNLDGTLTIKADIIEKVLSRLKFNNRERIVMVGDREYDIAGAKKNRIKSIAVEYGYGTIDELASAGPDYMVKSVEELKKILI